MLEIDGGNCSNSGNSIDLISSEALDGSTLTDFKSKVLTSRDTETVYDGMQEQFAGRKWWASYPAPTMQCTDGTRTQKWFGANQLFIFTDESDRLELKALTNILNGVEKFTMLTLVENIRHVIIISKGSTCIYRSDSDVQKRRLNIARASDAPSPTPKPLENSSPLPSPKAVANPSVSATPSPSLAGKPSQSSTGPNPHVTTGIPASTVLSTTVLATTTESYTTVERDPVNHSSIGPSTTLQTQPSQLSTTLGPPRTTTPNLVDSSKSQTTAVSSTASGGQPVQLSTTATPEQTITQSSGGDPADHTTATEQTTTQTLSGTQGDHTTASPEQTTTQTSAEIPGGHTSTYASTALPREIVSSTAQSPPPTPTGSPNPSMTSSLERNVTDSSTPSPSSSPSMFLLINAVSHRMIAVFVFLTTLCTVFDCLAFDDHNSNYRSILLCSKQM